MLRVLLNCSTIHKGGALQVALSTLKLIINDNSRDIDWYFSISEDIASQIDLPIEKTFLFKNSPSRSFQSRRMLKKIVSKNSFDAVFTLFGPAYVKFNVYHLCGVADSWVTTSNLKLYSCLYNNRDKINRYLLSFYKKIWYKQATQWVVESNAVKKEFATNAHIDQKNIEVVPNTVSDLFIKFLENKIIRDNPEIFNIFFLAGDYPHKNFKILPEVIKKLIHSGFENFIFTLTLDELSKEWCLLSEKIDPFYMTKHVINVGKVKLCDLTKLYEKAHILFFPTLLEAFSATPLEALYMNLPMVISNIEANKDIAKEYAIYFDPYTPDDAVRGLIEVMRDYKKAAIKAQNAKTNLLRPENIFTNYDRFLAYKKIILSGIKGKKLI